MPTPATDEWGLVRSDQEESEESYFVSMTDIMVGLLFIFIIMLMAFGLMLKQAQQETTQDRRELLEAVEQTRDEVEEMRNVDDLRSQMLQDIARRLEERGVQVIVREENGVIQLPDEILFAKGEAAISPRGRRAIDQLGRALDAVLACYAVVPESAGPVDCEEKLLEDLRLEAVFVEGHTDSDGSDELNWRLFDRARDQHLPSLGRRDRYRHPTAERRRSISLQRRRLRGEPTNPRRADRGGQGAEPSYRSALRDAHFP